MDWTNYDSRAFAWLGERAFNVYSQEGADGLLEAIFEKIGVANKWCFECGAADGLFFSNTRKLITEGWQAVLVEADDRSFARLLKLCDPDGVAVRTDLADGAGVRYTTPQFALWHCVASHKGATSLDEILKASYAPTDIDLMVIDVDGPDYYLFNALQRYRPRVIMCEYDQRADPMAIPELGGPGMSGDMAIINVGNARGYLPVCKSPYNIYFVRNDLIDKVVAPIDDAAVRQFYESWERETNAFLSDCRGVVHIGANSGQERDLYKSRNLPVIWVEALPSIFQKLVDNIIGGDYKDQRAINCLLTDKDGEEYDFGVANNEGQSSSIYDFADHKKIWPDVHYTHTTRLKSARFDTIVERYQIDLNDDYALVMDTQGSELLVLKGMGDLVDNFRYIRSETADFEVYKGCCQLKDLDDFLLPRGYKRIRTWRAAGRPEVGYAYEVLYARSDVAESADSAGRSDLTDGQDLCVINRLDGLEKPKEELIRLGACMTTGRLGFLATMDCIYSALTQVPHVGFKRNEGVYWGQCMTRAIEMARTDGCNYILTIDFDSLFTPDDIKRLVCHMYDNPEVDVIAPLQMRRENGGLLISTDGEVDLRKPLAPIKMGAFGLTLIRASALEKLDKPWFQEIPDEEGSWGEGRVDADMNFWLNAEKNGVKCYAALDVVIGHLELVAAWPDQQCQTCYQTLNDWRRIGKPPEAFRKPPVDAPDPEEAKEESQGDHLAAEYSGSFAVPEVG